MPIRLASPHKFAKPELANGLAKGCKLDSQVGSQVAKKVVNFTHIQITCVDFALGAQAVKNLRRLAYEFELREQSQRKSQKAVNFTHMQLTCDQLVSNYIGWPNGEKPCVVLRTNLSSSKVNAISPKSTLAPWPKETQVCRNESDPSLLTYEASCQLSFTMFTV